MSFVNCSPTILEEWVQLGVILDLRWSLIWRRKLDIAIIEGWRYNHIKEVMNNSGFSMLVSSKY
jgi:hypothetical protein